MSVGSPKDFSLPTQEELADCQRRIQTDGVEGFLAFMKEKTEEWKEIPLNIGVIGNSGHGKSSFINAIRRLTADDEDRAAAPVGLTETTTEIQVYPHPDNPNLKFWDLPGVGTPNFPKDKYLECIGFDKYDFFLLISATRFTENDAWLGREISAKNKKYYYVRTKIASDMENNKKAHPRTHDESKELVKVREASRVLLGSDSTPVFLIDNYEPQKYDFCELEENLIVNFPELKRSALVFSVRSFSTRVVQMKIKELRSRMWIMSLLSGAVAAVPVPGLSFVVDLVLVLHEVLFYRQQLGLDGKSLEHLAAYTSTDVEALKEIVKSRITLSFTIEGLRALAMTVPVIVASTAAEELSRFVPFIGSLIAAPLSLGSTCLILKVIMDKMEPVALDVIRTAYNHYSPIATYN